MRVDGRWAKSRAAEEDSDEDEEHTEGEDPSSPVPRSSPVVHYISKPEAEPLVRVPPSSHTMPTFSLGDVDMG